MKCRCHKFQPFSAVSSEDAQWQLVGDVDQKIMEIERVETSEIEEDASHTVPSKDACSILWPPMKGIFADMKVVELI